MKNILKIFIILAVLPLVVMCKEADKLMFDSPAGINFMLPEEGEAPALIIRGDTIVYTFAYDADISQREIRIPVDLTGFASDTERTYHIEVKEAANTHASTDYVALSTTQTFPAGVSSFYLPVTFLRNTEMATEVKKLEIRIKSGGELTAGVEEKLFVALSVSDFLQKPEWWDHWSVGFGEWHSIKLREWIKLWGDAPLSTASNTNWFQSPQECMAITRLKDLFDEEEFYDENNIRLRIPASF